MVKVVGMGPGNREYLTAAALKAIMNAGRLVGSKRQLEHFEEVDCPKITWSEGIDYSQVLDPRENTVVIASGEPGLYGILDLVLKHVPNDLVEVIPGISSPQYILAKLRLPMKDTVVMSLHARAADIIGKVRRHDITVILTDREQGPIEIAKTLLFYDIEDVKIYVGENLSYPDETIEEYTPGKLAQIKREFAMNVVVIKKCDDMFSESPTESSFGVMSP